MNKTVRISGSPAVVLRERGERLFSEILPSEIMALMEDLAGDNLPESEDGWMDLYAKVLEAYGVDDEASDESAAVEGFFDLMELAAHGLLDPR